MKSAVVLTVTLGLLGGTVVCGVALAPGRDRSTTSAPAKPSAEAPPQAREISFDTDKLDYQKKRGIRLDFCTNREQLEPELGARVAAQVWSRINPAREAAVIVGYPDSFIPPDTEEIRARVVKAEGVTIVLFRRYFDSGKPFSFLIGFEWPGRCRVFAVPREAAVGWDPK